MTQHIHRLVWALPANPEGRAFFQRLGVATHAPGYKNSERLKIAEGRMEYGAPPTQSKLSQWLQAFQPNPKPPPNFPTSSAIRNPKSDIQESQNWQRQLVHAGSGQTYYAGSGSLTEIEWLRIQARIPYAPNGLLYARLMLGQDGEFELVETNIPQAHPLLKTKPQEAQLLQQAGLSPAPLSISDLGFRIAEE